MPDLHAKLVAEAGGWGDGSRRFNLCVDCGAQGCPLCNGTGWRDEEHRHLASVPSSTERS